MPLSRHELSSNPATKFSIPIPFSIYPLLRAPRATHSLFLEEKINFSLTCAKSPPKFAAHQSPDLIFPE